MDSTEIQERVQRVFRDLFDDDYLTISASMTASDIDAWDSLAHVNLVMQLEHEFGVRFALGEMQALQNVGEMIDSLASKL